MKLKRLVSAVLAIGMALTILPTAAFAAGNTIGSSEVGGLEITEAGYPKVPDETPGSIVVNGVTVTRTNITTNATGPLDKCTGEGWQWTPYRNKPGSGTMTIASGYSYKGSIRGQKSGMKLFYIIRELSMAESIDMLITPVR